MSTNINTLAPVQEKAFLDLLDQIERTGNLPETYDDIGKYTRYLPTIAEGLRQDGLQGFQREKVLIFNKEKTLISRSATSQDQPAKKRQPRGTLMSDVIPKDIQWLWPGRLALGKLHMFDGDGGVGKSTVMGDVIARITTGRPMPYESKVFAEGGAVILGTEEELDDTVQPRLSRAGAKLNKIEAIGDLTDWDADGKAFGRPFGYPDDLPVLEAAIERTQAKIVIIDPVMGILGSKDIYKDNEVRTALAPLKRVAEKYEVAIILVRHITKSHGENLKHWGGGSVAFTNLSRIGLLAMVCPDNEDQCIFGPVKSNLNSKKVPKLLYSIVSDEDQGDNRPYVRWEGEGHYSDGDLGKAPSRNTGGNRDRIVQVLKERAPVAMTVQELAEALPPDSMSIDNLKMTLKRMYDQRQIGKSERGAYHAL
jgi:hypothetical protein